MNVGRKIFYDNTTGNVIFDTGERRGSVIPTTAEQDIAVYTILSERNRETFDCVELDYGQYAQDFAECIGYRINTDTKEVEFSYPDGTEETVEPVYREPLSEQVGNLQRENTLLKAQNNILVERMDFHEEVLSEIILTITS